MAADNHDERGYGAEGYFFGDIHVCKTCIAFRKQRTGGFKKPARLFFQMRARARP